MALNTRLSTQGRDVQLNAYGPEFDNGYFRLYDGLQPATPNTAVTTQVMLSELRFAADAFPVVSGGGPLLANPMVDDASADATGQATWARCLKADGTTVLMDMSVGEGASFNVNINSDAIQEGAAVSIISFQHSLPMQGT
jgi:hypothetical protein